MAIRADRHFRSRNVIETLADLMTRRGVPDHIRSDNGPEFTAKAIREWLGKVGVRTLYIEPGSPWENGYVESFNGKLRDESLDREIFYTLKEVRILTEQYRHTYNQIRPHSSLGSKPPAPQAVLTAEPIPGLVGLTYQLVQRLGAGQHLQQATVGLSSPTQPVRSTLKPTTAPLNLKVSSPRVETTR